MPDKATAIIFDLDDTLYKEIDFLVSAYRCIAREMEKRFTCAGAFDHLMESYRSGRDAFGELIHHYSLPTTKDELLYLYRHHTPDIILDSETKNTLDRLKAAGFFLGLMTDGRSITQRNKISALGLEAYFDSDSILISEEFGSTKPNHRNYEYFTSLFPASSFWYVGDNPAKDFVTPNSMGWNTVCLADDGRNIHPQQTAIAPGNQAVYRISKLSEIFNHLP